MVYFTIIFKDLLSHYAQLQAWLPFYKLTLTADKKPSDKYYRKLYSEEFPYQVAENLLTFQGAPTTIAPGNDELVQENLS